MFAFYDLETSGTSPAFDQPLQFAGILTDDNLDEIERIDIRCRLSPHILPAPWALAVTGVSPDDLSDPNLPSAFEFSHEISGLIHRWQPATWVGFNNIAFDEQMLRQMFFQNLHSNFYLTQVGGNDRMDVMKLVYATWVLANDALTWPTGDNGKIIFKLDQLAPANGFKSDNFHDALADVEATIHIAKLIRDRAPEVWAQTLRNRSKSDVKDLVRSGKVLTLVERFGAAPPKTYRGAYAGQNPENQNSVAFMDLDQVDPDTLDPDDATSMANAVNASPKQVRTLAINNAPTIFDVPVDDPKLAQRAKSLQYNHDLHAALGNALSQRFVDRPEPAEVEKKVYAGFYSTDDKRRLDQFQNTSWARRVIIAQEFEDRRLRWLASRLIYLNEPNLLSHSAQEHWKDLIDQRWQSDDQNSEWTTFDQAKEQLAQISEQGALSVHDLQKLAEYFSKAATSGQKQS